MVDAGVSSPFRGMAIGCRDNAALDLLECDNTESAKALLRASDESHCTEGASQLSSFKARQVAYVIKTG